MKLRLKLPTGQVQIELGDNATLQDLRDVVCEKGNIPHGDQELKFGFPPKVLAASSASTQLVTIGIRHGESLIVGNVPGAGAASDPSARSNPSDPLQAPAKIEPKPKPVETTTISKPVTSASTSTVEKKVEKPVEQKNVSASGYQDRKPAVVEWPPARPKLSVDSGIDAMERFVIPADNSCMFNAIAHCLRLPNRPNSMNGVAMDLRTVVSDAIKKEPMEWEVYTLGESDKSALEYAQWILNKEKWGGSIELNILSKFLKVQICTIDIKSCHPEFFPHEPIGDSDRIFLLYDGIHYDCLVGKITGKAYVGMFSPRDDMALNLAVATALDLQSARQFTDTQNFDLMCGVCYKGVKGQNGATEHAKATGHINFQEFDPSKCIAEVHKSHGVAQSEAVVTPPVPEVEQVHEDASEKDGNATSSKQAGDVAQTESAPVDKENASETATVEKNVSVQSDAGVCNKEQENVSKDVDEAESQQEKNVTVSTDEYVRQPVPQEENVKTVQEQAVAEEKNVTNAEESVTPEENFNEQESSRNGGAEAIVEVSDTTKNLKKPLTQFRQIELDLSKAVWHNDRSVVQRLLEAKANPNSKNPVLIDGLGTNTTPLHIAAYKGFRKVAARLLVHGADASAVTSRGFSCADIARAEGHKEIIELLQKVTKPGVAGHVGGGHGPGPSRIGDGPRHWSTKDKKTVQPESGRKRDGQDADATPNTKRLKDV